MATAAKTKQEELRALIPRYVDIRLRPYQKECIKAIMEQKPRRSSLTGHTMVSTLCVLATALGKTAIFSHIPHEGKRMLIISNGQELVTNPLKYFKDEKVGVEMGKFNAHRDFPNAQIISASIQSLWRRLDEYDPKEFDIIIVDEAHHSAAKTYRMCLQYFQPAMLVGVTATPKRADNVRLSDIYHSIAYNRDIKWGVKNGWLCDIYPRTVKLDIDLTKCRMVQNKDSEEWDFKKEDLAKAMAKCAPALAKVYREYAVGQTIINVVSIALAYNVASLISEAVAVTGTMSIEERESILEDFRNKNIRCLVSVDVLREGVDLPCTETIINARPTTSSTVYIQIVGRGIRLSEGKEFLNLIDIEGIIDTKKVKLCTAATLAGLDPSVLDKKSQDILKRTRVSDMSDLAMLLADNPESWAMNTETVQLWADTSGYDLHDVSWTMFPDDHFELSFKHDNTPFRMEIPAPDILGRTTFGCVRMPLQIAFDLYRELLDRDFRNCDKLWDNKKIAATWGQGNATEKQITLIRNLMPDYVCDSLTKIQASQVIKRLLADNRKDPNQSDTDNSECIVPVDTEQPPKKYLYRETIDGEYGPVTVYDYSPGDQYVLDAKENIVLDEYWEWLGRCIDVAYKQCGQDVNALIDRINKAPKMGYSKSFLRTATKYRYIDSLNGSHISRQELTLWLAKQADIAVPKLIDMRLIHPEKSTTFGRCHPNMTIEPFSRIKLEYPESLGMITGRRTKRLPASAAEIKKQNMEAWERKESEKKKRNRSRNTPAPKRR